MNKWLYENLFYQTSDKTRIQKIIDHYEIYKKISKLKGDIVECGVFKGVSLIRFLTFREIDKSSKTKKFTVLMLLEVFQDHYQTKIIKKEI